MLSGLLVGQTSPPGAAEGAPAGATYGTKSDEFSAIAAALSMALQASLVQNTGIGSCVRAASGRYTSLKSLHCACEKDMSHAHIRRKCDFAFTSVLKDRQEHST